MGRTRTKTTKGQKIECPICGALVHVMEPHLKSDHPEMTIEEFQKRFPEAPIISDWAKEQLEQIRKEREEEARVAGLPFLHEVFEIDRSNVDILSAVGKKPIPIHVLEKTGGSDDALIPEINKGYVFNANELKQVMLGVELNIPTYIYGHKGAGKTELVEQVCARTNRPLIRVQHTVNTEEAQIVGQWTVKDGATVFEFGPLPMAMINGWVYLADEYDFAMPNVLATYQAVLEGKPLMIKEAPINQRIIKPHPNFRFFATGNTNGTGDETGLYQGVTIQNSANYDRFGIVLNKSYLDRKDEIKILTSNTKISEKDASNLVDFARSVREAFDAGKIGDTISPRALLSATKLGIALASFRTGLNLAFMNKLSTTDKEACREFANRLFGSDDDD